MVAPHRRNIWYLIALSRYTFGCAGGFSGKYAAQLYTEIRSRPAVAKANILHVNRKTLLPVWGKLLFLPFDFVMHLII